MERLILTRRDEKVLPVTIGDRDIDLTFDVADRDRRKKVLEMLEMIIDFQRRASEIEASEDLRERIHDAVGLVDGENTLRHSLSAKMGEVVGNWDTELGDIVPVESYLVLITSLNGLTREQEVSESIMEQLEEER